MPQELTPSSFTAHLPETFDASSTRPTWAAYAAWVMSAVIFRRYLDSRVDDTTFVPLDSRYINAHIPATVRRPLLDDLIRGGDLESDNFYFHHTYLGGPGKCLCYRLGQKHWGAKTKPLKLTHPELLRKIAVFDKKMRDAITDPVLLGLRAWHDQVEVLPEAPYGENGKFDRMIEGVRNFSVCDYGRVHTNVTRLPRQYRQYLRVAGRELMSCDISTAQPLILANLLKVQKEREESNSVRADRPVFHSSYDSSLTEYLQDCLSGVLYDRIIELTGYSRDKVKRRFLSVVYGRPHHMNTSVGRAILKLYPGVFYAVTKMSQVNGHKALPRLMQQMESKVMIGRVAGRLLREHPEMPLLTLHDCVLVPEEYVVYARKVIIEEWIGEFGIEPNVKVSRFTAPQAASTKKNNKTNKNKRNQQMKNAKTRVHPGDVNETASLAV